MSLLDLQATIDGGGGKGEVRWKNARDCIRRSSKVDGLAEYMKIAMEATPPEIAADEHGVIRRGETRTKQGRDTEDFQKVNGYPIGFQDFRCAEELEGQILFHCIGTDG